MLDVASFCACRALRKELAALMRQISQYLRESFIPGLTNQFCLIIDLTFAPSPHLPPLTTWLSD
uniref:Uncharacterized protein n=2 Tax=Anguilla anguilla TaxID=7936 RepID=A0A0E9U1L0_ANGAN